MKSRLVTYRLLSYKKQELLTIREHLNPHPVFGGVRVAHLLVMGAYVLSFVL